jgi:hypothetical protein
MRVYNRCTTLYLRVRHADLALPVVVGVLHPLRRVDLALPTICVLLSSFGTIPFCFGLVLFFKYLYNLDKHI